MTSSFEPTKDFFQEKSLLDISAIVSMKRKANVYNFINLPKTAIITITQNVLGRKDRLLKKKIAGLPGVNYLVNDNFLICTEFGSGAPAIITLLEELRVLGVEQFVFAGLCGSLDAEMKEGDICFVQEAYSSVGCTSLYSPNATFFSKKSELKEKIISALNLKPTKCWSTDAPFRETKSLIRFFKDKGAQHVDMECAAVYAFAELYGLAALCIVITTDSFADFKWTLPRDIHAQNHKLKMVVSKIASL